MIWVLQILIDGCPLKDLDIKWLREKIGFVGQVLLSTFVFKFPQKNVQQKVIILRLEFLMLPSPTKISFNHYSLTILTSTYTRFMIT